MLVASGLPQQHKKQTHNPHDAKLCNLQPTPTMKVVRADNATNCEDMAAIYVYIYVYIDRDNIDTNW